ncbi:MAG: glycosylphosphatidylinositol specific phospholipase [Acidimicrobiaceae bacterium]|jgi:hypothetical protein|nr:glycosylphosphatidylinositol specific phospholipase [Acidimicrobiaceae bacterium]
MESHLPPSYEGSVVLDVGGDVGALVLYVPAELLGAELELLSTGGGARVHTEVRERRVGGGVVYAAVYPALREGDYVVELSGQLVEVAGGRVAEADWAGAVPTSSVTGSAVARARRSGTS